MVQTPLKVCVAGPSGQQGGVEVHTYELVKFLKRQGYSVLFADVEKVYEYRRGQIRILFKILQWVHLYIKVRLFSPDILVSTATGSGYRWLANFTKKDCFRIIQIVTCDYPVNDLRMRSVINSYDAVAAQSLILKDHVQNKLSRSIPCQVLPCFHQIDSSDIIQNMRVSVSESEVSLAYFGRLAGNKGLLELFCAWSQLCLHKSCSLHIWGTGPLKDKLTELSLSFPADQCSITMHGAYPTGKAYRELLMSYDGLVLPSQATEGLPLVLLEAAAVGLPILTTSIGGIPDFTENNLDVQVVGLGVDSLHHGLYRFINSIQYGGFSCSRHRKFFQQNYSFPVLESQWMVMLQNPRLFFHGFPT